MIQKNAIKTNFRPTTDTNSVPLYKRLTQSNKHKSVGKKLSPSQLNSEMSPPPPIPAVDNSTEHVLSSHNLSGSADILPSKAQVLLSEYGADSAGLPVATESVKATTYVGNF